MTTASDLPLSAAQVPADHPSLAPYPREPAPSRPVLTVVPSQPGTGEEIEFDEALRRAGPRLRRYAGRRLRDEHEAEEVVQEALLRAFQHRHLLATEDDLMAWVTVVTGRLVIDRLRVRGRSIPVAELPPASRAGRDTADVVVARDEARLALDALEAMPGRQASVLWAREVEGLTYDEIGDRFGMSEASVRSLLHRARRTLRREYTVRGGTLPGVGLVALAPWLNGLRRAARLRHVARRGAGAAAVAATGLAVAAVVPLGSPGLHNQGSRPTAPALRIKAVQTTLAATHAARQSTAAAAPVTATAPTAVPTTGHPVLTVPEVCGKHIGAGCEKHHTPTIYVKLPVSVAGKKWVGIATDKAHCAAVPSTPITECDSSGESK